MRNILSTILFTALIALTGCHARYVVPGGGVAPAALSDGEWQIQKPHPTATFPARVAVARVQASGYRNHTANSYGYGKYSVVSTRDIESSEDLERLMRLPKIRGIAMLNRLILPENLTSDRDLRQAAEKLQAGILLLYSFDTTFQIHDHEIGPLGVITLGMLPNQEVRVTSTCSAAVFDVQTGFIYGLAETTATDKTLASYWRSDSACDSSRIKAEKKAYAQMVSELEKLWEGILHEYATPVTTSQPVPQPPSSPESVPPQAGS